MPPGHALRSVSSRWVWHREHPPKHQPKITVRGSPSAIPYFSTTLWRIMMFTQTAQKYETTHIMISSWFVVPSAAFHWRDSRAPRAEAGVEALHGVHEAPAERRSPVPRHLFSWLCCFPKSEKMSHYKFWRCTLPSRGTASRMYGSHGYNLFIFFCCCFTISPRDKKIIYSSHDLFLPLFRSHTLNVSPHPFVHPHFIWV